MLGNIKGTVSGKIYWGVAGWKIHQSAAAKRNPEVYFNSVSVIFCLF
jgi:hypothetical protein